MDNSTGLCSLEDSASAHLLSDFGNTELSDEIVDSYLSSLSFVPPSSDVSAEERATTSSDVCFHILTEIQQLAMAFSAPDVISRSNRIIVAYIVGNGVNFPKTPWFSHGKQTIVMIVCYAIGLALWEEGLPIPVLRLSDLAHGSSETERNVVMFQRAIEHLTRTMNPYLSRKNPIVVCLLKPHRYPGFHVHHRSLWATANAIQTAASRADTGVELEAYFEKLWCRDTIDSAVLLLSLLVEICSSMDFDQITPIALTLIIDFEEDIRLTNFSRVDIASIEKVLRVNDALSTISRLCQYTRDYAQKMDTNFLNGLLDRWQVTGTNPRDVLRCLYLDREERWYTADMESIEVLREVYCEMESLSLSRDILTQLERRKRIPRPNKAEHGKTPQRSMELKQAIPDKKGYALKMNDPMEECSDLTGGVKRLSEEPLDGDVGPSKKLRSDES